MTTMEIGKELVALCKQGKNQEAIDQCYSPNIESVEPVAMQGMEQTHRGIAKIKGKNKWWVDNHEVHGSVAEGPFPHGDRFIVGFKYDGQRSNRDMSQQCSHLPDEGCAVDYGWFTGLGGGECGTSNPARGAVKHSGSLKGSQET